MLQTGDKVRVPCLVGVVQSCTNIAYSTDVFCYGKVC